MKAFVSLLIFAIFQSCCSQETPAPSPTAQPITDPSPIVTDSPLPPQNDPSNPPAPSPTVQPTNPSPAVTDSPLPPQNDPSTLGPPTNEPVNPSTPPATPEQIERDRVSLFEIVEAVIRHGLRAECFQKFNVPGVGETFQKTLQECLNDSNKSAKPLSEVIEKENKRHNAALDFIKKNTGGIFLLIRISVEMATHGQKMAEIFASHVFSEIRRRVLSNTVECSLPIFGQLIGNVDNNVELVKQCLIAPPAGNTL